ncbi:MAG: signal peptide peptidase SppA, partial [Gammaproteobacteria bacterium]|nr:signal peptide peptidase SppA [Gammaproteobacteria bacterium]
EFRHKVAMAVGAKTRYFPYIGYRDYLRANPPRRAVPPGHDIGLIIAQGAIKDGDGARGVIGGDSLAALIRKAARDRDIKAVVLRIDSPGGSINAAETIRQAVVQLRREDKPVVVSMSNVAASGGYWIAMDANKIFAERTTVTADIGVFALFPTIEKPLNKLGVHTSGVGTTKYAGALRIDRPMTPGEKRAVQLIVDNAYRQFTHGVAAARRMSLQAVDRVSRGRAWSGEAAKRLGLVDDIGGLRKAVHAAAQLAHLGKNYRLVIVRKPTGLRTQLVRKLTDLAQMNATAAPLPAWVWQWLERRQGFAPFVWMNDPQGLYSYCACYPDTGGGLR